MADLKIEISNCRNIKNLSRDLIIKENQLNLFFAANGSGKTTTVEVLNYLGIEDPTDEDEKSLYSYDFMESQEECLSPECSIDSETLSVMTFNEKWIAEHCFKESSLRDNTFQLFVETEAYQKTKAKRDSLFNTLRRAITEDPEIESLNKAASVVKSNLGSSKIDGTLKAASAVEKAYKNGSPFTDIPEKLDQLTSAMNLPEKASWLKWHLGGASLSGVELDTCPYCAQVNLADIELIKSYDLRHEPTEVTSWEKVVTLFEEAPTSFSRKTIGIINKMLPAHATPTEEEKEQFRLLVCDTELAVKQISKILDCVNATSTYQPGEMKDIFKTAIEELSKTSVFSDEVNLKIEKIITLLSDLLKEIEEIELIDKEQRKNIQGAIEGHENEFNDFLETAGYPYKVRIDENGKEGTSLFLIPRNLKEPVNNKGLSYGEKNAITLVLFLYEVLHEKPGLVIFDDPISSFDGDKRHAILFGLFSKQQKLFKDNLYGFTIALFTHDFLIVSDIRNIMKDYYERSDVSVTQLHTNSDGIMELKAISQNDIEAYPQLLKSRIKRSRTPERIFLSYVYARRYCELFKQDPSYKDAWDVLSSLIHKRSVPAYGDEDETPMPEEKVATGIDLIDELVGGDGFNYEELLEKISDPANDLIALYKKEDAKDYEKLQIVRILLMGNEDISEDQTMNRYADESYHVGGDYLHQLKHVNFYKMPYHVQEWCNRVVAEYEERYLKSA